MTLEPFAYEPIRAANRITFNRDAIPYYAFEDAETILSFGADFIETWLSNVGYARMFARMHSFRDGRAGTFIHVEPRQSLTASNADEWVRNVPGTEGLLCAGHSPRSMVDEGMADRRFGDAVAGIDLKKAAETTGVAAETIKHLAKVFAHAKPGLAIGGGVAVTGSNATETQVAINLLNAAAGNVGKTVRFGPDSAYGKVTPYAEVAALARRHGERRDRDARARPRREPRVHAPVGLKLADAIGKVAFVVSFANRARPDERAGARRAAGHPLARIVGRLRAARGRTGLASSRRWRRFAIRGRWATRCSRVGRAALGTEEGKGPLPWPTAEQYVKARGSPW